MTHVCLVIPPSPFLLDERVFPFLGILKIASALEAAGYKVEVLDLSGYDNYMDIVAEHARASAASTFGITATTPQMPAAVRLAQAIRSVRDDIKIVLGGTHATLCVASLRNDSARGRTGRAARAVAKLEADFDVIVAGDGEEAIFLALQDDAPKLIDADNRKSPLWLNSDRLNTLPFPARHLIDLESYRYRIEGENATSIIAQLGCPFHCGFCGGRKSPMLRQMRTRSVESVVQEMEEVFRTYGHTGFMFYDDELNVSRSMVSLMEAIIGKQHELGVSWRLRGFIKAELFTEEQAEVMYQAGFRWILVGFESGSPRILDNIKKIATIEDNTRCVDIAHRYGLKVKALMSLGHPGESATTVGETRKWLMNVKPDDFDATIITPYPGSPYYDDAELVRDGVWIFRASNGDALYQQEVDYRLTADYYKGKPGEGYVSHVWTDTLSSTDLVRERDQLEVAVRAGLGIPYNPGAAAQLYEHSMGQTSLPLRILRSSSP